MYNRKKDEGAIILQCSVPTTDFPAAAGDDGDAGWKEFVVDADSPNETQTFDGLEFVFKIRVTACTDLMSSKTDLSDFYQDTDGITYSEEVIRGEDKQDDIDNALLQCWRHNKTSSRAVLWFLGRNDCFMHPHVAKALFVENGYDVYVLNYSCVGLCRKRGWVVRYSCAARTHTECTLSTISCFEFYHQPTYNRMPMPSHPIFIRLQTIPQKANYNSHCRTGNFDLYDSQIEGAISIMKSHIIEYKEVIGYAHSTGGPVLMNYLIKNGDDFFNGFIFNSPFLDWGHVGGDIAELVLENGFGFLKRLNILGNDSKFNVVKTAPDPDHPDADDFKDHTPIQYMDDEIVISAWSAKLWSQYFFDFRCRPLYSVPLTVGFVNGVTRVQNKIMKLKEDKKYITIKPFVCITSRADDTLEAEETLSRIDAIGPSRCEIELRHNAHDVFLSEEKSDVKMALEMTKSWMKANGFE